MCKAFILMLNGSRHKYKEQQEILCIDCICKQTSLRRCHRILELIMVDCRVAIWRAAIQKRSEHAPQANEHTLMLFVRYLKPFKLCLTSTVQLDQCEVCSILKVQLWRGHQSTKCTHVLPTF